MTGLWDRKQSELVTHGGWSCGNTTIIPLLHREQEELIDWNTFSLNFMLEYKSSGTPSPFKQVVEETNSKNRSVCTHQTMPAGLPAPQWPGQNLPVWPQPPSTYWLRANSLAVSEDLKKRKKLSLPYMKIWKLKWNLSVIFYKLLLHSNIIKWLLLIVTL